MWMIAGLGNPGRQYMYTWHNMGYLAVDMLCEKHGISLDKDKFKGMYGKGRIAGQDVIVIKPVTYMNLSGECLVEASRFFKIDPSHIITVYDDIDIKKGTIRVRPKGSAGTHNGMKSCIQLLGTDDILHALHIEPQNDGRQAGDDDQHRPAGGDLLNQLSCHCSSPSLCGPGG